jgi:ribosomal protein S21
MEVELKHHSQKELDYALKKFNKMVRDSGVLEVVYSKREFVPKSTKLKLKREQAAKRRRMDEAKAKKRKLNRDNY